MIYDQPIPQACSLTCTAPQHIAVRGYLHTDPHPEVLGSAYSELAAWIGSQPVGDLWIDIDSPGGDISGIEDLCHAIESHDGTVYAHVSGQCASAAYWLACACDEITAAPSAVVGSIGAMLPDGKIDTSELDVVATLSPRKNAADEQWQELIDAACERFLGYVASRRRLPQKQDLRAIAARCGEGKMMTAAEALSRGLIDKVEDTVDETQVPAVMEERTPEDRLRELEERHSDLERRVAEVEAIVENLRREEDDTAAEEQQLDESSGEMAAMKRGCVDGQLAALSRDIGQLKRAQRDAMIAGLVACGRLQQQDVEIARLAYDANPAAFARRYGRAPTNVPVRLSSGQAKTDETSDPVKAAFAALSRGEHTTFIAAYKAAGGR